MTKKRKAPPSQQTFEQKTKLIREEDKEESSSEEEEEEEEEKSSSEEEEGSEEKSSSEEEDSSSEEEESSSEDEETDESSKGETLRQLLEPFEKAQIIDLLKQAASSDTKLLESILKAANSDPTHRNIFVYGLGWDTTSDQLIQAFKPFGEIEESKLVMDKNTGRAKGYAFVLFKTRGAARKALKLPQKKIGSRVATCQLKVAGSGPAPQVPEGGKWKIYVGNVGPGVNPEKLKAFFRKFGEIEDGPMGVDSVTNQFKGFAIITYKSAEGYKMALEVPIKMFEGSQLHCKKFAENHTSKNTVPGQSSVNNAANGVSYGGFGVNPGIWGANLNSAGYMMGQNPAIGLTGNAMLAAGYNPAGFMGSGLSIPPIAGAGGNYGMNSISPSVSGSYGSQAALLGLGPYQNSQMGHKSVGTIATPTASRTQGNFGPETTTFPSYFNR